MTCHLLILFLSQQNQKIPCETSWKWKAFSVPSSPHLKALYVIGRPQLEMVPSCSISSVQVSANETNTLLAWICPLIKFNSRAILCNLYVVTGGRTSSRRNLQTFVILWILSHIHPISFHIRRNSNFVQSNHVTRHTIFTAKAAKKNWTIHNKVLT